MTRPIALVVDDEPAIRELLSITLEGMGIASVTAEALAGAKTMLGKQHVDLCLTDMRLPDGNGLELVAWMQQRYPRIPVAVITAHGNVESAVQALKAGAFDFVSKPVDLKALRTLVSTAMKLRANSEPRTATGAPSRLQGDSATMEKVREMIAKVARSQAPVHVSGESGTGKELVARLIHDSSPRADKPFVPVNCGAIPTELMESEFFGHRKGSFTGAVGDNQGLFQAAEGGTLFLDEVADLPIHMQVKLLRVIQEKAVRPVGDAKEVPVDVRILSATHKDLAKLVAEGRFRQDLYYRIDVIEVHVPPLRERIGDIPELARHILNRLSQNLGVDRVTLTETAVEQLCAYDFPGNVRELENILERAVTLCENGKVRAEDIHVRNPGKTPGDDEDAALGDYLGDVERDAILRALEQTRYNKTAAAKVLGISFRALRYRIKKLGID